MPHLIDKSALVAEIERFIFVCDNVLLDKDSLDSAKATYKARKIAYSNILSFLDTLEVKEYSEEYDLFLGKELKMVDDEIARLKKLKVKEVDVQKERMSECPYRQVGCTMYEGKILECKGACSWVVDYPRLKELKAQKGE